MAQINFLAIIVAAIVQMVLGALWYSPMLFSGKFMGLIGKTNEELKKEFKPARDYTIAFMSALLMSIGLRQLIDIADAFTLLGGIQLAFLAWAGLVVTSNLSTVLFEGRKLGLYSISMGYYLVIMLLMGGILGAWK